MTSVDAVVATRMKITCPREELAAKLGVAGQARQLRRFGSPDQVERAAALLEDVKRELYAILASGSTSDEHAPGTNT
jgi:hypothetical protein